MDEEMISVVDAYLGDIIEEIITKYNYNVDIEEEYDELIYYIYRRLKRAWFNGKRTSYEDWERALETAVSKRKHLEILLSYLISRYVSRRNRMYTAYRDWREW